MGHSDHRSELMMPPAVPLFASSWMALFCLIRSGLGPQRTPTRQPAGFRGQDKQTSAH